MEELLHHVRVDEIADYYLVNELRKVAKQRIDQLLVSETLHESADFVAGLSTFLGFRHDPTLKTRMAQLTSTKIRTCIDLPEFLELLEEPENQGFVVAILKASAQGTPKAVQRNKSCVASRILYD